MASCGYSDREQKINYDMNIYETHIVVLRKIHFKQMKIIAVRYSAYTVGEKASLKKKNQIPFKSDFFLNCLS